MPELPEVETIVKELRTDLMNKRIENVRVFYAGSVRPNTITEFIKLLKGRVIRQILRRGKLIIVNLSEGMFLLIHLKMTGQLVFTNTEPDKHTHIVFDFGNNFHLHYRDVRKFGFLSVTDSSGLDEVLNQRFAFGPEPLENDFTVEYLKDVLAARKAPVKSLLLDQKIVAGIGNIYADESLFKAKIHPARSVPTLSKEEIKKLHKSIREILKLAIERGGSSSRNYVRTSGEQGSFQNFHKVYKKSGLPCPRCGTAVERIVIAGRGTHFCPKCQI